MIISCGKKVYKSVIGKALFCFAAIFEKGFFIFCGIFATHPRPAAGAISPGPLHQIRPKNPKRKKPPEALKMLEKTLDEIY